MSGELSELGRMAVWYCENKFGIIPLKPNSKQPATVHGLNDWFDNPESAREFWSKCPNHNIGIVCGVPSHGLLVLDVDVGDDKDGRKTIKAWEVAHGELPETAMSITGSGGRHYLYRTNRTTIRPSTNATLGVDVRSDGSYIVAPPSVHPNGTLYEWWESPMDTPPATADGTVYDFLDYVQRNGSRDGDEPQEYHRFELPKLIRKGDRDNTLHKYGCSLRGKRYPDDAILAMLDHANRTNCEEPMDYRDIQRIAKSVCKHGPGHNGEETLLSDLPDVGKPGEGGGEVVVAPSSFRTSKGKILTNKLAQTILANNHARYIDGALAIWNGRRWVFDKRAIEWICLQYADDAKSTDRTEVIKYIEVKAEKTTSVSMDKGYYVQFDNCTWDVANMCEVEPCHEMFITATLPLSLDVNAPYGDADRFIESIAGGDEATMTAMQEIIGACMCCKRVLSQSPMLIGKPTSGTSTAANGKSTYIDVIRSVLGDENVSSMDIASLGDKYGPAELTGKLANLGDDIPDGFLKGTELSLFKKLVTGNEIKAERKYHDPFDFKPSATMVFSMNAMPRLADTTDGVFRRLAYIPFRRTFTPDDPDFDPHIIEKLTRQECLQRFAVLGLLALHDVIAQGRDRLTEIPDMIEEIEEIRIDNNVVKRWMFEESITESDIDHEPVQDIYEVFTSWCDDAGEHYKLKRTSFTKEIRQVFGNVSVSVLMSARLGKKVRTFVVDNKQA